ncbi:4-hydroxythreonine-4-phosphate dehydrogenase PdxA [Xanthobacter sp. VTT E-85241]|uniref:4-hydroxythreonine-4-phosphate dehydrogenase PdxA n=1 Tax=Roseixanthobacter finlandensis TaxID=3119922 RepID=UPI003727EA5C
MGFSTAISGRDRCVMGLAMGDPGGIGAELAAMMLTDPVISAAIQLVVLGNRRMLEAGAATCGLRLDLPGLPLASLSRDAILAEGRHVMVEVGDTADLSHLKLGEPTREGGAFALENFRTGIRLAKEGVLEALCFTPFNKYAMRLAYPSYQDEIVFISEILGAGTGVAEFNVADIWTGRVTSHVPLSQVAPLITREAVLGRLVMTDRIMRAGGVAHPKIAVAGLNPHAGDNGNFGREEIEVIAPAVAEGRARGIDCDGPFSPDTVFVRATRGDFNSVLTMYHDQGQIAMKLMNFEKGVVLFGGFPFPICTPAHGTAYDIAGAGKAHPGAMRATLLLAASLASGRAAPAPVVTSSAAASA